MKRELRERVRTRERSKEARTKQLAAAAVMRQLAPCRAVGDTHRDAEVVRTERRVAFCMEACIVVLWRRGGREIERVKSKKKKRRTVN